MSELTDDKKLEKIQEHIRWLYDLMEKHRNDSFFCDQCSNQIDALERQYESINGY